MERIYVTVRARPLSPEDSKSSPWRISGNSISLAGQPAKFDFDRVFGEESKTCEVYEARTKEIVASAVRGFNGTVFAYGQTNSGKTHTMRGSVGEQGIIPLSVHDLFQSIQEDVDREFLVRMSYMEIYNEEINDLLVPEHRRLQIHESLERGIYVAGLREEIVTSPEQVLDFMEFGESHRHIGETNMNLYSSRSHTIFRMIVESREKAEGSDENNSCDAVRVSVLNLVDLAGSERAAKTGAEGMRLKEGSHINKSLMTLGTVIKKLSEGADIQGSHVPYRDSKLTRILQPALGGNANTAIICNITLAQVHTDETKSSLQFASRALRVKNCAHVNEILTDAALLKRQRKEIEELRGKLMASHSEHWEEEILNLRNTLLQSELEKERIALELEEEKKAKAQREKRLIEQAKKIANLSSMVFCSERDEKSSYVCKNRRRVTWCPGPFPQKLANEVLPPDRMATIKTCVSNGRDEGLPPPFEELMQQNEVLVKDQCSDSLPDYENNDKLDSCLPDVHALVHVTNRRKFHSKRIGLPLERDELVEQHVGIEHQTLEAEIQGEIGSASCGHTSLSARESEAILVIKQLQDQIKQLELEETYIQSNLDNVVELTTKQSASFRDKYEELHQEVLSAHEEARLAHEKSYSHPRQTIDEVLKFDISSKLSTQIQAVALEVDNSREMVDSLICIMDDYIQNFSILSEFLLELKSFSDQEMVDFKSVIDGHNQIYCFMKQKIDNLELEKSLLQKQFTDHHQQIENLKSDLINSEKILMEKDLQHELEKDDLLSQILSLQKEVSYLSNSSLAREKETLRKELDKTKLKLKDTEFKLKNTIQEKIKLESERAQAEREIKHLHGQMSLLERDMRKRDSLIDKRHESKTSDLGKAKGFTSIIEQTLQDDYEKLEVRAFEMEAELASLNEALVAAIEEKQEAFSRSEILDSELEAVISKLNSTNHEIESLQEEVASMKKKLHDSELFCKELEASLGLLSREKEEMALQLTDALLEVEAEKSTWSAKEKALSESKERVKVSDNKIAKLSEDLLEVRCQLDSCREQCTILKEKLTISEENMSQEKENSTILSSEIVKLKDELNLLLVGKVECTDLKSKVEELSSKHHHACKEVNRLQEKESFLGDEREKLHVDAKGMDIGSDNSNDYHQNLKNQNLIMSRERDNFVSQNLELEAAKAEAEILTRNYENMLSETRNELVEVMKKLSSMEIRMHDEDLNNNKEVTKLRMRLRSTQSKLDMFRGRYRDIVDEMGLMNRKFEEASSKLKDQLGSFGVEILRLKKQLAAKE
ncbi:hypothetical protein J5N97_003249 [Dioscorea zingiberensis]|uniref:Kinesin motor domain-containing protein n=1 Tax=Dioscorea zingiberensis TaxID=325984 RepID=A0A9D5D6A7_9LILI|nr:hypothetical protein J5N97_003249 [Dioscorea zingiberensis]